MVDQKPKETSVVASSLSKDQESTQSQGNFIIMKEHLITKNQMPIDQVYKIERKVSVSPLLSC